MLCPRAVSSTGPGRAARLVIYSGRVACSILDITRMTSELNQLYIYLYSTVYVRAADQSYLLSVETFYYLCSKIFNVLAYISIFIVKRSKYFYYSRKNSLSVPLFMFSCPIHDTTFHTLVFPSVETLPAADKPVAFLHSAVVQYAPFNGRGAHASLGV